MEVAVILLLLSLTLLSTLHLNKKWNIDSINRFEERFQYLINSVFANFKFNMLLFRDILYDYMESKHNKIELSCKKYCSQLIVNRDQRCSKILQIFLLRKRHSNSPGDEALPVTKELSPMSNRIAVVTGGTRGIGLEVVRMLLQCDMKVIVACRDLSRGEKAIAIIRESGVFSGTAKVMRLDNSSLASVKNFIREFKLQHKKLDILINNAGVFSTPYNETIDGFEEQWGVNYLSHFFLTMSLVPLLKNAKESDWTARIVNVSSCSHEMGSIRFQDVNNKKNFVTLENYSQSKLAILMFTKKLARELKQLNIPVRVNAVHPGIVNTELFLHDNSYFRFLKFLTDILIKNAYQGAVSIVFAAINPIIENNSGVYFYNCREKTVSFHADDEITQDQLFKLSLEQLEAQNLNCDSAHTFKV